MESEKTVAGESGGNGIGEPTSVVAQSREDGGPSGASADSGGIGVTAGGGGSGEEWVGVREALAGYGIDLRGQFQDDDSALAHLAAAYRQGQAGNQLARYGEEYLRNADKFQAWMRGEEERAAAERAKAAEWWKAPEYDGRWAGQITRDAQTGELRALPGSDPKVVEKYLAWAEHQRGFLERFSQDPIKAIQPGIEAVAREVAQRLIEERLGGYQEKTAAARFIEENSGWLHARDGQGQVYTDPGTGRPMLSEWGQRFLGYVQEAERSGLRDVGSQQRYALGLVQRDYLLSQRGQGAAAGAGEAAKANFLSQAARQQPGGGVSGGAAPAGVVGGGVQNSTTALMERLRRKMAEGGYASGAQLGGPEVG